MAVPQEYLPLVLRWTSEVTLSVNVLHVRDCYYLYSIIGVCKQYAGSLAQKAILGPGER